MNLTYNYQASAGQMGAGSTAGNAGQLLTISGTLSATTESAAYTYDNLGRLVTSNQTSNGSPAQRRFAYDRWGNRTSVWDATSGGTLIQNVALVQAGGVPNNQIAALSNPGWYGTYTYDAAGNVTNDGVHTYQYDAANRIVNVDGGGTAQYDYDQNNRRYKKTVGGMVTHYVWEGSQVVSEHNASGTLLAEYVYSSRRMIAKSAGGVMQYHLADRLSERLTLDGSGNVIGRMAHLPFGEDFAESGSLEKHHLTSYERDTESGLDYAISRSHSSSVGRFQQADPYKPSGYMVDPQSWNRYAYVGNDPINFIDLKGLLKSTYQPPPVVPGPTPIEVPDLPNANRGDTPEEGGGRVVVEPKEVEKHPKFTIPCNKDFLDVTDQLKERFTELADYLNVLLGWIKFEDVKIKDGAKIPISVWSTPIGAGADFHVRVTHVEPNGWTFTTESDHVFYPGTISFSVLPAGNGQIEFRIDLKGETNGAKGTIGYYLGGDEFEDKTWKHLAKQIQEKLCGN